MNIHKSLLLAASLSFAACASTSSQGSSSATIAGAQLTVHVVEASGGAWSASKMAREAMESLPGIERMMMSGTRATLVLKSGAKLTDTAVTKALKAKGLKFESLEKQKVNRAGAAYVAKTPKFTWAGTAKKVRATLMNDFAGVQDVFCGTTTIVHMKKGSAALKPGALKRALATMKIECESVTRDDTAML